MMGARRSSRRRALVLLSLMLLISGGALFVVKEATADSTGQMVIAVDFSIAPTWFDPGETPAMGTPYIFLYALHDALIKPLPGNTMAPCLAEAWTESPDGKVYEFKLREGLTFH